MRIEAYLKKMKSKKLYLPGKERVEYREYKYVQITGNSINKNNFVHKIASAYSSKWRCYF